MFTEIGIENFKAFGKMQRMPLKPITLLYGPNSSGKSSLIQSLLLFKQTLEESKNDEVPLLSRGNLVDLGDYSEFIHKHDDKKEFKMSFSFNFIWDPNIDLDMCWDSRPVRKDEVMTLEFTFLKDKKTGDVIVKSIRLFYLRNPEPLLVYKNILLYPKFARRIDKRDGASKTFLFLESINFNSEFIRVNWNNIAKNYRDIFSRDLNTLKSDIADEETDAEHTKEYRKILKHLEKIKRSFEKKSFEDFANIGMPPNDRIIKLSKCFPLGLTGRGTNFYSTYCNTSSGLLDYESSFGREAFNYTDIVPIDFIVQITNLLNQYLNKICYIGPLRAFPERAYSFSGNVGVDVGKSGKSMPDILLKRPDIVEHVNQWFNRFEIDYELKVESFKRNLFTLTLIDKNNGCEVSPTDVGFGISQLLPIIVQGALPAYIFPGYRIICIEQPEIHLHPRLQAELGSFFADSINAIRPRLLNEKGSDDADINGNQFIIETHSEHLILRLLRLIRNTTDGELEEGEKPLRPEDVAVIYAKPTENGTELMELRISEDGDFIDKWPDGFFTEREKELF